jgi:hypothetical protein
VSRVSPCPLPDSIAIGIDVKPSSSQLEHRSETARFGRLWRARLSWTLFIFPNLSFSLYLLLDLLSFLFSSLSLSMSLLCFLGFASAFVTLLTSYARPFDTPHPPPFLTFSSPSPISSPCPPTFRASGSRIWGNIARVF